MKLVLKILKVTGILLLVLPALIAALLVLLSMKPFVPNNYTKTVDTGGGIEARYLSMGAHEVRYAEAGAPGDWKKFEAFYPAGLETEAGVYPVVVFANGTGASAEATLVWLLEQNSDPNSVFYQKVDASRVGISGHSQGGVAVFNAVSEQPHGGLYTCAVSLCPTEWALAMAIGLEYDPSKMAVPTLILAAAENDVITPDGVKGLANAIPAGTVTALRPGMDHGRMLYSADGYVTAWFMWQLQGDQDAAKAFVGESPELLGNTLYQDAVISLE